MSTIRKDGFDLGCAVMLIVGWCIAEVQVLEEKLTDLTRKPATKS